MREPPLLQASCGWIARLVRRVNTCELLINAVIGNRPKMLKGLNQKVRDLAAPQGLPEHMDTEISGEETEPALTLCMLNGTW